MLTVRATAALLGGQERLRAVLALPQAKQTGKHPLVSLYSQFVSFLRTVLRDCLSVAGMSEDGELVVSRLLWLATRPSPLRSAHALPALRHALHSLTEHLAMQTGTYILLTTSALSTHVVDMP